MSAPTEHPDLNEIRTALEQRRDQTSARAAVLAQRPELGSAQGFGKRIGDGTTEAISRLTEIIRGGVLNRDRTQLGSQH